MTDDEKPIEQLIPPAQLVRKGRDMTEVERIKKLIIECLEKEMKEHHEPSDWYERGLIKAVDIVEAAKFEPPRSCPNYSYTSRGLKNS